MKRHWQEKEEAFTQACEEEPGLGREAETERSESRQQNKCSKRNERERRTGREIVGRRKQGKRRWKKKKNRAGEGQREPTKPTRVRSFSPRFTHSSHHQRAGAVRLGVGGAERFFRLAPARRQPPHARQQGAGLKTTGERHEEGERGAVAARPQSFGGLKRPDDVRNGGVRRKWRGFLEAGARLAKEPRRLDPIRQGVFYSGGVPNKPWSGVGYCSARKRW
jgi:hypothetical protein